MKPTPALVLALAGALLAACPPPSKCDAQSCPTGCCDAQRVCQRGDTAEACGTGGRACQGCIGGSCDATKTCVLTGGGAGGGAAGGGGGADAGSGRTVTWVRRVTRLQEDGGTLLDERLPAGQYGLFVRNAMGTGYVELTGTRSPTSYVVPHVPAGPYFIVTGGTWVESTVDFLDTGFDELGRTDVESIDAGAATLDLTVSGLPAWNERDELGFFSVGANLYGLSSAALIGGPDDGEVPTLFSVDYGALAFVEAAPRIDGNKGDTLLVSHLQSAPLIVTPVPGAAPDGGVANVPLACQFARGSARLAGLTVEPGVNVVPLVFAASAPTTIGVTWPRTQWDARRAQAHPQAVTTQETLFFAAEPLPETASGDLIACSNDPRSQNPISDVSRSVTLGNPFPPSWTVVGSVEVTYRVSVPVADAGTWAATGTGFARVALGQPLSPGVSAPQQVLVQGVPAHQIVTAASASPLTVSWQPPMGAPEATDYQLTLVRITRDALGQQSRAPTVTAVLRSTSFTFPPGALATGAVYQVRVRARASTAPPERPFGARIDSAFDAISGPFLAR